MIGICEKQDIFGQPFAQILNPTFSPNSISREPSDNNLLFIVIIGVIFTLAISLLLNMTGITADKIRNRKFRMPRHSERVFIPCWVFLIHRVDMGSSSMTVFLFGLSHGCINALLQIEHVCTEVAVQPVCQ